jgi:hypothetical protein
MILPEYRRNESITGYVQRCRGTREMRELPLASVFKTQLCRESGELQRRQMR